MDLQKIAKVLALAASDNDAEALHALRTARRLLAEAGADFVELAGWLGGGSQALENAVFDLRNEVRDLRCENERLRQGRGPGGEPTSMFEAARAASDVIRLRAELADERAGQAALRLTIQEVRDELSAAIGRLSDAESRRMRLEVENRRLSHANHALAVELGEIRAAQAVPMELLAADPRPERKPRGGVRAKAGANQYALF